MGSTSKILETCSGADEEESFLFAMQLASASVLPMVLKSAVELDLLELIKKAGPGAFVSPADLSAQLPTTNPEARVMLDRILRLLTTYSVLNCRLKTLPDGGVERLYGLAPVCRFLTKNEDGVSMAPLLLMNQDKVLMESWVSTVRGKEFWCERRHSCRDGRSLQICPTPTLSSLRLAGLLGFLIPDELRHPIKRMDIEPSKVEADSDDELLIILQQIMNTCVSFFTMVNLFMLHRTRVGTHRNIGRLRAGYSLISRIPERVKLLRGIIGLTDETAIIHLRMDRFAFTRLLMMLENSGGLKGTRNSTTAEQLAQFLNILAHHTKNRMVKDSYKRSTRTVSKHFHNVLKSLIKIHPLLLVQPEPIDGNCTDTRWSCFQGCLGALDGTYVNVIVPKCDMGRYRNRKGNVAVNILAACDKELNFTYVLSGWEGSAADSRVLSDAVTRYNGLRVPTGNYYLCDNGYTNGEGFLTPYRGVRYHVNEWASGNARPRNKEEFFNMKHCRARNVIERAFGLLKKRWAILRSPAFYPIKIQNRMIMACCLLHNFIRRTMHYDPMETEIPPYYVNDTVDDSHIDVVESSPQWSAWRDNMASEMYNEWRG